MASFRALECFVAAADSGSITEAARLLFLSQPAVSHHISALEQEVGIPLVIREPRGVRLTAAGRAALADARRAVDAAASTVRSARDAATSANKLIRIASSESLTVALLTPVIGRWHVQYPDVFITLRESASTQELLQLVETDQVDLAVIPEIAPRRLNGTVVAEEEIVLALHHGYPLVDKDTITLDDVDGRPLVQYAPENELGAWIEQTLARAGVRAQTAMRTTVTTTAPQLAAAGLGVAVCPVGAIGAGFSGRVRSFTPRWVRPLSAVTRDQPESVVARFIADLKKSGLPLPAPSLSALPAPSLPAPSPFP
jgi:DNA-binding transcriptional LysR family regulator